MSKKKKQDNMPYRATPSSDSFYGQPDDCYDIINKYGTYNIQPTVDSGNEYPTIGYGLPKEKRKDVEEGE